VADVFFNGQLIGEVDSPQVYVDSIKQSRRESKLSKHLNIYYHKKLDTVYIVLEKDRVTRPVIVVKEGKSLLTTEKVAALREGAAKWSYLV
jgi:DNA-directed RNA polymerase beta subunit